MIREDIIELCKRFNELNNTLTELLIGLTALDDAEYMMDRYDKSKVIVADLNSTRLEIKALCNGDDDLFVMYRALSRLIDMEDYNGAVVIRRQIEEYAC